MKCDLSIKTYKSNLIRMIVLISGTLIFVSFMSFITKKILIQNDSSITALSSLEKWVATSFQFLTFVIVIYSVYQLSKAIIQLVFFGTRSKSSVLEMDSCSGSFSVDSPIVHSSNNWRISSDNIKLVSLTSKDGYIEMEITAKLPNFRKTDRVILFLNFLFGGNGEYTATAMINPYNKTKIYEFIKREFPSIETY
ncbi:hypothetical protein [Cytobacillus horneckiae]|uniref:hypothetical protein n=1 Tax=Cytobacillus horneckiae TaxID=549687 RepID=UPI003D215C45